MHGKSLTYQTLLLFVKELAFKNINTELSVCASIIVVQKIAMAITVTDKCSCTCSMAALQTSAIYVLMIFMKHLVLWLLLECSR